eukprot:1963385-Amphidinium_carterae.1
MATSSATLPFSSTISPSNKTCWCVACAMSGDLQSPIAGALRHTSNRLLPTASGAFACCLLCSDRSAAQTG